MSNNGEYADYVQSVQRSIHEDWRAWLTLRGTLDFWRGGESFASQITYCLVYAGAEMAARKGKEPVKSSYGGIKFTTVALTEEQIADVWRVFPDTASVVDAVARVLDSDVKLGITYNRERDAFIVSVTQRGEGSTGEGTCFTSFAGSWFEALAVACYKWLIFLEEKMPSADVQANHPRIG